MPDRMNGAAQVVRNHPSTSAAGVGGAGAVLFFYLVGLLGWHPMPEVAAATTTVAAAAISELRSRLRGAGA